MDPCVLDPGGDQCCTEQPNHPSCPTICDTDPGTEACCLFNPNDGSCEAPPWLLSIENSTDTLHKVDINTGVSTDLCVLDSSDNYPSLTFNRENILFGSRTGSALDLIDPCTCQVTPVGSYGGFTGVNGITSDQLTELFGVASTQDVTIKIDTMSGMATQVGALGFDWGTGGATWSDELQGLWAINGSTDFLYTIDKNTGAATPQAQLSFNFGTVGIELHPGVNEIYACSSNAVLFRIDSNNGDVIDVSGNGTKMQTGSCTNLAAPYKPVFCNGQPL
jgi:hypothetical protein